MRRVIVIGCGGSGKSTLARAMGEKTGLPVVHLDRIFWSPGNWQHLEKEEFDRLLAIELEKPEWILDGNFNRTMPMRLERCDTVIWLDFSRFTCITGWLKRVINNWGTTRADMGPGCSEWLDPEFFRWIWDFNKNNRQRYRDILSGYPEKTIHIFKNRRQVKSFLKNL